MVERLISTGDDLTLPDWVVIDPGNLDVVTPVGSMLAAADAAGARSAIEAQPAGSYASAAQGARADTAVQLSEVGQAGGVAPLSEDGAVLDANGHTIAGSGWQVANDSLVAAIGRAEAAGGGEVLVPPGTHIVSSNIEYDRSLVRLVGRSQFTSVLKSNGVQRYIKPHGHLASEWGTHIKDITLDGIGIIFGETSADWGYGSTLENVQVRNSDVGVTYRYNCWATRILNCRIHNNTTGVKFDFVGVANNSGSNMVIDSTVVFNNTTGVEVVGTTADGTHLQLTDTDIENNSVGLSVSGGTTNVVNITSGHFELNRTAHLAITDAKVFINGCWMHGLSSVGGTRVANFDLAGAANVRLASGRLSSDPAMMVRSTASTAWLQISPAETHTFPLVGSLTEAPGGLAVAGSARCLLVPRGSLLGQQGSSVVNVPKTAYTPAAYLQSYALNGVLLEGDIQFPGPGASGDTLSFLVDPSGYGPSVPLPVPNGITLGHVRWIVKADYMSVSVSFNNGMIAKGTSTLTHEASASRRLLIRTAEAGAGGATLSDCNLTAI